MAEVEAHPYPFFFDRQTALVVIDMQRDFLEPGGFGELLGNDVSRLRPTIEPIRRVLDAARSRGLLIVHTREGHRPDLADCPPAKLTRGGVTFIGTDAFTAEGQIRAVQAGSDTVVEFNTAGASGADMQVQLADFTAATLKLADFLA